MKHWIQPAIVALLITGSPVAGIAAGQAAEVQAVAAPVPAAGGAEPADQAPVALHGPVYISGKVMGQDGPAPGVTVALYSEDQEGAIATVITAGNGTFVLKAPEPGQYRLRVNEGGRGMRMGLERMVQVPAKGMEDLVLKMVRGGGGNFNQMPQQIRRMTLQVQGPQGMMPGQPMTPDQFRFPGPYGGNEKPEIRMLRGLLSVPVNVHLHDATVAQAARALSQASHVNIRADEHIPDAERLTLDAEGVSLAQVLETIGRQTDLMIAPDPEDAGSTILEEKARPTAAAGAAVDDGALVPKTAPDVVDQKGAPAVAGGNVALNVFVNNPDGGARPGIVLKPWPFMDVDGKKQVKRGPSAPWSADWGVPPTVQTTANYTYNWGGNPPPPGFMNPYLANPGMMNMNQIAQAPGGPGGMPGWNGGMPGGGGPDNGPGGDGPRNGGPPTVPDNLMQGGEGWGGAVPGVTVTPIGDRLVVVAEPGQGPRGARGFYLMLFRVNGDRLDFLSQTFHSPGGMGRMAGAGDPNAPAPPPFGGGF